MASASDASKQQSYAKVGSLSRASKALQTTTGRMQGLTETTTLRGEERQRPAESRVPERRFQELKTRKTASRDATHQHRSQSPQGRMVGEPHRLMP